MSLIVNDAIILPRPEKLKTFDVVPLQISNVAKIEKLNGEPVRKPAKANKSISDGEDGFGKICPACGLHNFKRWPWGWDAHAAHKCTGLASKSTETRKREFKAKFL